ALTAGLVTQWPKRQPESHPRTKRRTLQPSLPLRAQRSHFSLPAACPYCRPGEHSRSRALTYLRPPGCLRVERARELNLENEDRTGPQVREVTFGALHSRGVRVRVALARDSPRHTPSPRKSRARAGLGIDRLRRS